MEEEVGNAHRSVESWPMENDDDMKIEIDEEMRKRSVFNTRQILVAPNIE